MSLNVEQVLQLAPDSNSAAAGRKLVALKHWPELGRNAEALWGKCQGSAVYQVRVDLSNMGYSCSCPSRKFPCKHVLGLMLLAAESPDALATTGAPEWVDEWLAKRRARDEKKSLSSESAPKPVDAKARQRRAEKREARVEDGLKRLDLWMRDLVRSGLAGLESRPRAFWDDQAKRLVDAQASGLASRVARLATIPGSSRHWPQRLLSELGRLSLLIRAWQRIQELDADLQSDVRQMVGWTISQDDIEQYGEQVSDNWIIAGQWIDDEERVRTQRSWVVGRQSRQIALVLQFSVGGQSFPEALLPGMQQEAVLACYPGASRQRAKFLRCEGQPEPVNARIPGHVSIEQFLTSVSDVLARQPWVNAFGCVLHDVTLVPGEECWQVRDAAGFGLPLLGRDHWKMLAVTGSHPFDLTGEWDGDRLRPLGVMMEGQFRPA